MIVDRGIVVCSPPDSEFLFCRNVLTGAAELPSQPRRNARYVAGLHNEHLILVSENSASSINLRTKRVAWETEFPAGLVLAGKGLWQSDSMLLPLSGRTVIRIHLADGSLTGQATVDQELGNLFAYRNQLISVNSTSICVFYTREALAIEVDQRLAANPADPWALNQKSQLLSADGRIGEAMQLLQESFEMDPDSADTRFLMVDTLLAGLESDFEAYAPLASKLDEVVELGPQRFRFLQQLALGKQRAGDYLAAFERLYELMNYQMELADKSQGRSTRIRLSPRHTVDSDAWISAELARGFAAAAPAEQKQMAGMVEQTLESVQGTMVPLRRQRLRYLAWLPPAATGLMNLAGDLVGGAEQTTAEQLLQPLLYSPDADTRSATLALLRRPADADLTMLGPAGRDFAEPTLRRERLTHDASASKAVDVERSVAQPVEWNRGRVEHGVIEEYALFSIGRRLEVTGERYGRPQVAVALSDSLLAIYNQNGENVGHLAFNPATSDLTNSFTKAVIRGGLLIVETISEIAAFDLYSGFNDHRDALLWRHSLVGAAPDEQFFGAGMGSLPNAVLGITIPRRQIRGDLHATVGPLTPAALIIQSGTTVSGLDPLTGRILWSREGYDNDLRFSAEGLEVAIVNPAEGKTEIIDCRDGALIRQQEYRGNWVNWFSHGPMLVDFRKNELSTDVVVRLWNALSGEVFQDISVSFSARAEVCENRYLVIAESSQNKLHYVDLAQLLYRQLDVPVERDLTGISVERFEDRIVILSNNTVENSRRFGRNPMERSVSGYTYALDAPSGDMLWSQPGKLFNMSFPLNQPRNSPFMVAYRFTDAAHPEAQSAAVASVAMVDLRDGQLAFADDAILVKAKAFNMLLKPNEQELEMAIGDRNYKFHFTPEARPPQPVFVFGYELP